MDAGRGAYFFFFLAFFFGAAFFFFAVLAFGAASFNVPTDSPDTGSVTPIPLPRSSRQSRKLSSIAIIPGRALMMLLKLAHLTTMQKVWSPVFTIAPSTKPLKLGRALRCASR